jgi:hypothetical protein
MTAATGDPRRTARITGLLYLAVAITGMLGFLVIRPQIYVDDPAQTLANLVDRAGLARVGVVLEMGLVLTQALVAVWFYKLFVAQNRVASWAVAAFGIVNAVAIMMSAVFMATALAISGDPSLTTQVHLLGELSSNTWEVAAIFFGLWLIPMGHLAIGSGVMPKWLGRTLIVGGLGYVLSAFLSLGLATAPTWLIEGLVVPATIGELWMIGSLLFAGARRPIV